MKWVIFKKSIYQSFPYYQPCTEHVYPKLKEKWGSWKRNRRLVLSHLVQSWANSFKGLGHMCSFFSGEQTNLIAVVLWGSRGAVIHNEHDHIVTHTHRHTVRGTNWAFVTTQSQRPHTTNMQKEWNRMWNIWEMIQFAAENQPGGAFMITDANHRITWTQREITFFISESMAECKSLTGKDPELMKTKFEPNESYLGLTFTFPVQTRFKPL